jgi:hypothetical protein
VGSIPVVRKSRDRNRETKGNSCASTIAPKRTLFAARSSLMTMSPLFLAVLFGGTVLVTLFAFEGGLRFGRWRSQQPDPEQLLPVRLLVTSTMGLLSFILGFTFGLASSHFDARSESAFNEATAIGTAYRRAGLLPDPDRAKLRHLIREYIDLRLEVGRFPNTEGAVPRLRHLQERMWAQAAAAGQQNADSASVAPLLQSLSDVIDVHGERVIAGMRSRIPLGVWLSLLGIMVVSVAAAGYHAGLSGTRRSVAAVAYALVFGAVIVVIAAGDIPGSNQLQASHKELRDLRARLITP